ncbi:MAG: GntR family transcriptional regulator [Saccharofermentanales bacterium]|jgi:DNA-binding GntR family transcriptional regulator
MRTSDIVYDQLRMMITTAQLKPGSVLIENDLSKTLNAGRTPIREALNRLNLEHFVRIIPRQCILVSDMPLHELESIYQMRHTLSILEGELAATKRDNKQLRDIKVLVNKLCAQNDPEKRVLLDREFHILLSSMTGNIFLQRQMDILLDLSIRMLFVYKENIDSIDDAVIEEYEDICIYLEQRNVNKLISCLQQHVRHFRDKFLVRNV